MDGPKAIEKITISDEISNQIQKLIISGYYKQGQKIPSERELCSEFNVSRTSIREALKGLIYSGFLEKKGSGTYVRKSFTDILIKPMQLLVTSRNLSIYEIFEARLILEIQNAKLAARKATDEDIYLMRECIDIMKNPNSTIKDIMDSSVEFHYQIARATKNRVLIDMYQVIYGILHEMRSQADIINNIEKSIEYHILLYEAIKEKNEFAAERVMYKHISLLFQTFKE